MNKHDDITGKQGQVDIHQQYETGTPPNRTTMQTKRHRKQTTMPGGPHSAERPSTHLKYNKSNPNNTNNNNNKSNHNKSNHNTTTSTTTTTTTTTTKQSRKRIGNLPLEARGRRNVRDCGEKAVVKDRGNPAAAPPCVLLAPFLFFLQHHNTESTTRRRSSW
jgi:hypothetical protein